MHFVTSNENKLREAREILGFEIERLDLDLVEIQSIDVKEVVKDKALRAFDKIKKPVIVEDTGLFVNSWKGYPGALVKWMLKTVEVEGFCKKLDGFGDRSSYAETVICYYDGVEFKFYTGRVEGLISDTPRGETNFGWDPIFIPKGYDKTFAELGSSEKNKISMRKIAFEKLREELNICTKK
jgi:XTP/dITP diphosphohydrolase